MNTLSKLIYLGELSQSLSGLLTFVSVVLAVGAIALTVHYYVSQASIIDSLSRIARYGETVADFKKEITGSVKVKLWPACLCGTLCVLTAFTAAALPSKDTVYAIAASQLGEQVLKTPLANKAEQAVETWLDKQIAVNKPAS